MNYFNQYFLGTIKNKYANFSGKAKRSEYWYYALFYFLISLVLAIVDTNLINPMLGILPTGDSTGGILGLIFSLGLLIPSLAVGVRRLHDIGKSGWWFLILLIPVLGVLVILFFLIQESK